MKDDSLDEFVSEQSRSEETESTQEQSEREDNGVEQIIVDGEYGTHTFHRGDSCTECGVDCKGILKAKPTSVNDVEITMVLPLCSVCRAEFTRSMDIREENFEWFGFD